MFENKLIIELVSGLFGGLQGGVPNLLPKQCGAFE
jgi:hypothetical protein